MPTSPNQPGIGQILAIGLLILLINRSSCTPQPEAGPQSLSSEQKQQLEYVLQGQPFNGPPYDFPYSNQNEESKGWLRAWTDQATEITHRRLIPPAAVTYNAASAFVSLGPNPALTRIPKYVRLDSGVEFLIGDSPEAQGIIRQMLTDPSLNQAELSIAGQTLVFTRIKLNANYPFDLSPEISKTIPLFDQAKSLDMIFPVSVSSTQHKQT